jgi:hypothetical protein
MERRSEGDLDSALGLDASENGDRVRGRPRDSDLEGMVALTLECRECVASERGEREALNF